MSATPWKVVEEFDEEGKESLGLYVKDGDEIIASLPGIGQHNFDNANKIAAAPELLEALKWAMNRIEKKAPHEAVEGDGELYAFAAASAAITKATGGDV